MDFTEIQGVIGWIVGLFASSLIAIVIGVINIIRSGKMVTRDVRGADLTNNGKEVDVARAWKGLAAETALETLEVNKRLQALETKIDIQEDTIKRLESKIEEQDGIIAKQAIRIDEQDKIIEGLEGKLCDAEADNRTLLEQLREQKITPKIGKRKNGTSI